MQGNSPRNDFGGICGGTDFGPSRRRYGRPPVQDDAAQQDLDSLWKDVQARLRASVPASTFQLWLEPLTVVGSKAGALFLSAPEGIRAWTERRYAGLIREALVGVGSPLTEIDLVAEGEGGPRAESEPGFD